MENQEQNKQPPLHTKCLRCRRPLTKLENQQRGMGNVCFRKWQEWEKQNETLKGLEHSHG